MDRLITSDPGVTFGTIEPRRLLVDLGDHHWALIDRDPLDGAELEIIRGAFPDWPGHLVAIGECALVNEYTARPQLVTRWPDGIRLSDR